MNITPINQALVEAGFVPAPIAEMALQPTPNQMHPEQIKASIRMAGSTPAIIADELGVSRTSISQIIHGTGRSQRIEKKISEVIKTPVLKIWPNRKQSLTRKKGSH